MPAKRTSKLAYFLTFTGIAGGFLVLLYVLVGHAVIRSTENNRKEFSLQRLQLQEAEDLVRSHPNPSRAREEIERKAAEFREIGYSKKQLPKMVQALAQAAEAAGLKVISIRPRDDIKAQDLPPGVMKVYVELILYGEFHPSGEFLERLTAMQPYQFTVESLSFNRREKGDGQGSLESVLLISTYMVF